MTLLCIATSLGIFLTLLAEGSSQDCPENEVLRFPLFDCRWCRIPTDPCYLVFERGCECMPGFARNEFGHCIEFYLCPREPPGLSIESSSSEMSSSSHEGTSSEEKGSSSYKLTSRKGKGSSSHEGTSRKGKGSSSQEGGSSKEKGSSSHEGGSSKEKGSSSHEGASSEEKGSSSHEGGSSSSEEDSSTSNPCPPFEELTFPVNECNRCTPSSTCNLVWIRECDCKPGYARDDYGFCIPRTFCPNPFSSTKGGNTEGTTGSSEAVCPQNEEITYPINECNKCRPSQTCSIFWVSGCDCKEDYKRDDTGVCIPAFLCPNQPPVTSTEGSSSEETSTTEGGTSSTEGSTSTECTCSPQESSSVSVETTKSTSETSIITKIITRIMSEIVTVPPK